MRSVFFDGAQFVTEPPVGEAPNPQSVDAFISSWQASIRDSTSSTLATAEWITETRMSKVGKLIRVDVVFQAKKRNDPAPKKPGLDSLVLAIDFVVDAFLRSLANKGMQQVPQFRFTLPIK